MTTSNTPSPTCVGHALYLEFEKNDTVTQVLFMPEGMTSAHRTTNVTLYRRRLTTMTPRKTWRAASSPYNYMTLRSSAASSATPADLSESIMNFATTYLASLAENGWTLRNQMIVVEVTAEDLEDSRMHKTPYKVLGRVWKTRKKLGFPKEFIVTPATSPAF